MLNALLLLAIAAPSAADLREAEHFAEQGVAAYRANAPERAAEYFLRAYALSAEPTQLFNAAKALEAAGDVEHARRRWAELAELPTASDADRTEALAHLPAKAERKSEAKKPEAKKPDATTLEPKTLEPKTLEPKTLEPKTLEPKTLEPKTLEPKPAAKGEPVTPIIHAPAPASASATSDTLPWIVTTAGAATAATGLALWIASANQVGALESRLAEKRDGLITGIAYNEALSARRQAALFRTLGAIALSAGIATAIGGTIWLETRDEGAVIAYGANW